MMLTVLVDDIYSSSDASIKKTDAPIPIPIPTNSIPILDLELVGIRIGAFLAIFFKSTAFDLASSNRSDQIEALLFIHAFFQPFSWREKKIVNRSKEPNSKSDFKICNRNHNEKTNSKSNFTIRDRNRSSKFEIVIAMKKKLEKAGSKS
ncbi:unnamed protein product [Rotaria socialis]|uniref:Uncharacterized protein n=1 Tax=Rotaria socialis TaxID=392032 RepID=A0A818J4E6_9BILA|nr:unnamed protein product [Rotaria socialis]